MAVAALHDTCLLDHFCHSGHSHCGLLHHYCLYHLEKRQTNQNKNQSPQPTQLDIHLFYAVDFAGGWIWLRICFQKYVFQHEHQQLIKGHLVDKCQHLKKTQSDLLKGINNF